MKNPNITYNTRGDLTIQRTTQSLAYANAIEPLVDALDTQLGALFASNFEYPGRYTRWDMGFINPPILITAAAEKFTIRALNDRGKILLPVILTVINNLPAITILAADTIAINGEITPAQQHFAEELRSKQPSIFTILRAIIEFFYSSEDAHLGLYGAFGYDLTFQFEPIELKLQRPADQRDLVLFLPDEIYIIDHRRETALLLQYEFSVAGNSTHGMARSGKKQAYIATTEKIPTGDHKPGEYAESVRLAQQAFKRGDLFEVVPGQTFYDACDVTPAEVFRRLRERNPSPYGFLINLGDAEYLVGASPEMYVRVNGTRVETCPISGTIARGDDAINDATQILTLLNSQKDTAELTMCTDVDRNDKSRVCEPGSVRVIGRRQIEIYSRLIHTVDHVEGTLRADYDALDAFLTHTWAVTVTGAPKLWAMQFLENHEKSVRRWYGGAIGLLGFNGDMNTGLTLRTVRIKNGIAEVRAGATLLYDSIPEDEEKETRLKASALLDAIRRPRVAPVADTTPTSNKKIAKLRIVLVDHQDSFVHTLANYFRQTGAEVHTLRAGFLQDELEVLKPDLIVLSPGPGRPEDFNLVGTIQMAINLNVPIFGVCLGLQGLVEYFGGNLDIREYPMHGKLANIHVRDGKLFSTLPANFTAGLYHSLYADKATFPTALQITAEADDGVIMAIEHKTLPIWAVQFHPESILSLENNIGMKIIERICDLVL